MKLLEMLLAVTVGASVAAAALNILASVGQRAAVMRIVSAAEIENSAAQQRLTDLFKTASQVQLYADRESMERNREPAVGGTCARVWVQDPAAAPGDAPLLWLITFDPPSDDDAEWRKTSGQELGRLCLTDPSGNVEVLSAIVQPPLDGTPSLSWDRGLLRASWRVDWQAQGQEAVRLERLTYSAYGVPFRMR